MIGRILFIDIDGVFNTVDKWDNCTTLRAPGMIGPYIVDRNRIDTFNHVMLQLPFVRVVVSSTWRLPDERFGVPMNTAKDFCRATGILTRLLHKDWRTPHVGDGFTRDLEITEWLNNHPEVFKSAAMDDKYQKELKAHPNTKSFHINHMTGYTYKDLWRVVNYFGARLTPDLDVVSAGGPLKVSGT